MRHLQPGQGRIAPIELLSWVERLTGLDTGRSQDAISRLRSWKLGHLERELLDQPDVDTIVAAVLLAESVDVLAGQGVDRSKLMKKLRDARGTEHFWPAWAEIRSAAILVGHPDNEVRLQVEADRARGRHADFTLAHADGTCVDLEFKAVGLSAREVRWHQHAAGCFSSLLPPVGLSTVHGWLDQPIRVNPAKRDRAWEGSRDLAANLRQQSPAWANVRGVAIVGHETEHEYLQRVTGRLKKALSQLRSDRECWVGLWWGNGAAIHAAHDLLDAVSAPANVAGITFIGQGIAVPWSEISCFAASIDRAPEARGREVRSAIDDRLAGLVLDRFESSSGIRPTLLKAPGNDGAVLLRRDGRRRLFPFNLLFDADPRELATPPRQPSPVQDTKLMS